MIFIELSVGHYFLAESYFLNKKAVKKNRKMIKKLVFLLISFAFFYTSNAQVYLDNVVDDESDLYAQTKQINQFFRRFNAEESKKGKRLYEGDKNFRDAELRADYLENLYDLENKNITSGLVKEFISNVNSKQSAQYIDFYDQNWYAEIDASFKYKGKDANVIMYMKIEKENLGYKWVISNIFFNEFDKLFYPDTSGTKAPHFIHPMSHEIRFMSLRKIFDRTTNLEYYSKKEFSPDYLSLFLFEIKNGNLVFSDVNDLKFHFLQVDGWYFEIQYFNRKGYNTGWLISNLLKVTDDDKANFKF